MTTVLLVVWVVGQFPWLMALVAGAHGSHEMSVAVAGNRVAVVLVHPDDVPVDDHHHGDHVLEFAAEKSIARRVAADLHLLPALVSCPLAEACTPVSELISPRHSLSALTIPSQPLRQLRATVLVV